LADIESNANTRIVSGNSTYKIGKFKEYKIGSSKNIIDEIDDFIGPLYGLSKEEVEFIKNYELEFRLSDEDMVNTAEPQGVVDAPLMSSKRRFKAKANVRVESPQEEEELE